MPNTQFYPHVPTHVHAHVHTQIHAHIHTHAYTHLYTHVYAHAYTHVQTRVSTHRLCAYLREREPTDSVRVGSTCAQTYVHMHVGIGWVLDPAIQSDQGRSTRGLEGAARAVVHSRGQSVRHRRAAHAAAPDLEPLI